MKKKFITGLLLMAVTAGGFSTLTSCKDTEEDLRADLIEDQNVLRQDLLAEIARQCDAAKSEAITAAEGYTDTKIGQLNIPDETQVTTWANAAISAWAAGTGANDMKATIQSLLTSMGYTPGGGGGTGSSCNCALKDLTPEQAQDLLAFLAQAKAILGDKLDGKGGIIGGLTTATDTLDTNLTALNSTVSGLATNLQNLAKVVNGDPAVPGSGLVAQVAGLQDWFKNFTDETGAAMTPAKFQEYVQQGAWVKANKAALDDIIAKKDAIEALNKAAIDELNKYFNDLAGIDDMYTKIFKGATLPEGESAFWNYGEVMQNIINNSKDIATLQNEVDAIFGRINDLVTSLILQSAANNIYGTFNTPLGINSMILMANYGHLATSVTSFPVDNAADMGAECYTEGAIDWSSITSDKFELTNTVLANTASNGQASLGQLWFTVNPGTVNHLNKAGFELVNSRDEVAKVNLIDVTKDDETLIKFGVNSNSRAAGNGNGLYNAVATVALEDLDAIKVNIESGLVQSLKDAVNQRTAASMAHMLKEVFNQLHNLCDANALRYTYESISGKGGATQTNKVYSNYGLAATAFKPLSFATLQGTHIRHLPIIERTIEIDKDMVNLDLGTFEIDSKNFQLNLNFGKPTFKPLGTVEVTTHVTLNVTGDGGNGTAEGDITIDITDQAEEIVSSVTDAIDQWLGGVDGQPTLDERVDKAIWYALFNDKDAKDPKYAYDPSLPTGVVADLLKQVNNMTTNIQDKLYDLVDQINKDYLGKVNRLVDKYNSVAERINKALDDPNHYLQPVMFYRNNNGGLGFLSRESDQPSQFKGNGEAIELYATTYNFETVAPAFKKIVGVTKVTDETGALRNDLKNDANKTMAKILDGRVNRVALDVRNAKNGVFTYEIAYQALDYTGHVSTVKCYVMVNRK
ncbi:MAG: hypothetical protein NC411_02325 [Bacteroides sp.]|nr:hypothetical protein [Bacteroides sp.]